MLAPTENTPARPEAKVLIVGGAGFIGSTVATACLENGITPVILDNLSTGREEFTRDRIFYPGDMADAALLDKIFAEHPDIQAVVHCAALIVVPESVAHPLRYYRENVAKSLELVDGLLRNGCTRLLFSSSAAIYRPGDDFTVDENSPIEALSPYARSKAILEQMLADCARAYPLRVLSLRYFNPIGADPQLRTGLQIAEPTHVLGRLIATSRGETFQLTGTDWPTRDGSGIRDYVHVWDLARAHVLALRRFDAVLPAGGDPYTVINLGTGDGTTVRELVHAFEEVVGRPVDVQETARRPGDSAGTYTRSARARELLGWAPTHSVADGIRDSLRWAERRAEVLGPQPTPPAPATPAEGRPSTPDRPPAAGAVAAGSGPAPC
ncbi:UDP-glucose 4-epimerase GalE [Micromonospora sp. NPDC050686]|uniref:UDP-glucose 4-epimerase GalE n=1 Tax=Micromonospora sp. NPDC050686 TaxID=3154631 RepID=UPI0033FC3883